MFEKLDEDAKQESEDGPRLRTVAQMLQMPEYVWASESYLRHAIFEAEDRLGSGGTCVPGNGLAPAIVRLGRKVLIDLDEFNHWVERHRMRSSTSPNLLRCNTKTMPGER